jgi:CRP/FNR family transcriptional regulator, cyclic AMP receptor protein
VKKRSKVSFDPKIFLATVGEGKTISKYRKDQIVFSQGRVADAVFYIQQGKVKLTVVSEQGKEAVVAILGQGHFFGEGCLNGHPLRISTTTAIDECVITRLEKATMIAAIHNEPELSELFMSYLLHRNSRIEEDLIDQLFNSTEKRLARLLLLLANFGKEGKPEPIVGKYSQETLAGRSTAIGRIPDSGLQPHRRQPGPQVYVSNGSRKKLAGRGQNIAGTEETPILREAEQCHNDDRIRNKPRQPDPDRGH